MLHSLVKLGKGTFFNTFLLLKFLYYVFISMNFRARECYSVKKLHNLVKNLCNVFTNSFTIMLKSIKYCNFFTKLCTFFTMVKTTKIHASISTRTILY